MKKLMIGAVCAMMAAATFAEPKVEITKAYQAEPGNGKVSYTYTVSGLAGLTYELQVKVGAEGCDKTETVTIKDVTEGTATKSIDAKTLLGKAYPNVTLFAELKMSGVQLWANGPYFAECNVGATKPEEVGYFFWWGDTVGYKRNLANNAWVSVKDGKAFSFEAGNCKTYNLTVAQLYNNGYIDANSATGKLKPGYDAATANLGGSWRMPTSSEFQGLVDHCTRKWTTQNGISGYLVTGTGDYSTKSIFLPQTGGADRNIFSDFELHALYWSSSPNSDNKGCAWSFYFNHSSSYFKLYNSDNFYGYPVRPVR